MSFKILITYVLLCYSHLGFSQSLLDKKVSVKFKKESIYHCLREIEAQSSITFSYNFATIKKENKLITSSFINQPLLIILSEILKETSLQFKEVANQITIYSSKNETSKKLSLSGFLLDKQSQEKLIGAKIYIPEINAGCISNAYGYYYLELDKGDFELVIDYIGMKPINKKISIKHNLVLNFELEEDTLLLNSVVVTNYPKGPINETEVEIGVEKISINPTLLSQIPSSNGIPDITKFIQNIAGIQPVYDGSSSFQVRGLGNGNNLILLDEIPIYHSNHLLGRNSIINTNSIRSATIYKDYIPANFGIRNSSVLDIYTKEGNLNKFHMAGGLGANVPFISLEGPIIKNKASFFISGRKSFNTTFITPNSKLPFPDFYDITLKLNYKLNNQNKIYFTSFIGHDKIKDNDDKDEYKWGNNAFSIRWNRLISEKIFRNLTLINSTFYYNTSNESNVKQTILTNQIKDNFTYYISNKQKLNFGASIINTRTIINQDVDEDIFLNRNNFEAGIYATYSKVINPKIKVNIGVRIPMNLHIGTQDTSYFLQSDLSYKTKIYDKNKPYDVKVSFDPRLLLSYQLNEKNSLQTSATITTQFTHILNYHTKVLPIQIWINSSKYLKPERNYQATIGWNRKGKYLTSSTSLYYRFIDNVIDFVPIEYENLNGIESRVLSGNLINYGAEFNLQYQKTERYFAKLAYTYNKSKQTIEGINNNQSYLPEFNRPHYVSFNQYFIKSEKWEFGTNFVYHSKTVFTLPTDKYEANGIEFPLYSEEKNLSYLPYHDRIDLSFKRTLGIKKKLNRGIITITLTNVLQRKNVSNAFYINDANGKLLLNEQNYITPNIYFYYYIKF